MKPRIVLRYQGEGDPARSIRHLGEVSGAAIVTLTLDVGQGRDLEELRDRALVAGAVRAHVLDVRDEFARDFVLPVLRAGVSQTGADPLAVALGLGLAARKLIEVAAIEGAASIAHGEVGDDRQRLESNLATLDDHVPAIALAHAAPSSDASQANLWGRVCIGPAGVTSLDTPASVDISFTRGVPRAINGVSMPLAELIECLSTIAGRHGVGRMVVAGGVNGTAGAGNAIGIYEAPAAVVLDTAQRALETAVVPPELIRIQRDQAVTYAQLVYGGRWFTEARTVLDTRSATVQQMVTGTVRIKLFGGELLSPSVVEGSVVGVSTP